MRAECTGDGPRAIVGLHGWAGSHKTWRRLLPYVDAGTTFHALDLPGYGASKDDYPHTLDELVSAISIYLKSIDAKEIVLLGNCGGGLLAIEMARVLPSHVHRVVMLDPFGYPPLYFRVFLWGQFGRYAYFTTFANPLGRWVTNGALASKRVENTNLTRAFEDVDHELALHYLRLLYPLARAERFSGTTCAVDIAYGERTFGAVRDSLPLWRQVLPQAQCHELAGAGHEPIKEATEQLARLVFSASNSSIREGVAMTRGEVS